MAEVLERPTTRHACAPGWESYYHDGGGMPPLPAGYYMRPLDLPPGTVVRCDCGRVWVAVAMKSWEHPALVMGRVRWRLEKRRERRRRLRRG